MGFTIYVLLPTAESMGNERCRPAHPHGLVFVFSVFFVVNREFAVEAGQRIYQPRMDGDGGGKPKTDGEPRNTPNTRKKAVFLTTDGHG
jgi:hypothetical protein